MSRKRDRSPSTVDSGDDELGPSRSRKRLRLDPGLLLPPPAPFELSSDVSDDPGIELFIPNVPGEATQAEVTQDLAAVLHDFPYLQDDEPLINFDVHFKFKKPGEVNDRFKCAWITIPNERVGENLLEQYGDDGTEDLYILNSPVRLLQSHGEAKPLLVKQLRRAPFSDPQLEIDRAVLKEELAVPTPFQALAFGVWSNEQVFSAEATSSAGINEVWYDADQRTVLVRNMPLGDIRTSGLYEKVVVIHLSCIRHIWSNTDEAAVLFHLSMPAAFEHGISTLGSNGIYAKTRLRKPWFDETHADTSPFTSRTILLQFSSNHHRTFIHKLSQIPHCPLPQSLIFDITDLHRAAVVYSTRQLFILHKWYHDLPLSVALQCEQAIRNSLLTPLELTWLRFLIDKVLGNGKEKIAALALQNLNQTLASTDPPGTGPRTEMLEALFQDCTLKAVVENRAASHSVNKDVFYCHLLSLRPSGCMLDGPFLDQSNRVLRLYPEHHNHFLRVSFNEEGGTGQRLMQSWGRHVDWARFVDERVGETLRNGFELAGRHYEWLGYAQSALKEHQVLFMTPFKDEEGILVDAKRIRAEMGVFHKVINQPAKYGARMAQAFSATSATITIPNSAHLMIPDIERNGHCHTDGNGDMSPEMALDVWTSMRSRRGRLQMMGPPSAFQARFGGCKGVWMVNSTLIGKVIRSRPSQMKFDSDSCYFEVTATSEHPVTTYLNRPLVKLLEDLGVPVSVFLKLQGTAIKTIERAQQSYPKAAKLFQQFGLGTSFRVASLLTNLSEMLDLDFLANGHVDFVRSAVLLAITHCLREIKYRARIPVKGPTLIGVCDTWGVLKPGEVYVKLYDKGIRHPALQGKVVITRSPVIHPGDAQFATAIGEVPADSPLSSLTNVLVFSTEGDRPLSSCLGGGDLDGDLFNVITDPDLFPKKTEQPGSYTPVRPRVLNRPSTIDDVANFVVDYVLGDILGRISSLHLTIADQSDEGSFDPRCIKLAELASHAVDFPKSGVPVNARNLPRADSFLKPDFQCPPGDDLVRKFYFSDKALGKMFRAVPIQKYAKPSANHRYSVDASIVFKVFQELPKRYPTLRPLFINPDKDESDSLWGESLTAFCQNVEKTAFMASLSREDHMKLSEEEILVGSTATVDRVDRAQSNLLHRARAQTSELAIALRREVKGLDANDMDEDEEEESQARLGQEDRKVKDETHDDESESDDDVQEIPDPRRNVTSIARRKRLRAISRGWMACHCAFDSLVSGQERYGTRLFTIIVLELLLTLVRKETRESVKS